MAKQTQPPLLSIDKIATHVSLWERMRPVIKNNQVAQALLFVGPRHAQILSFAHRLMAELLCQGVTKPCEDCQSCRLVKQSIHPDIHEITQDPPGSAIKIEQIRELQHDVYQKPQNAQHRFVLIHPADQLNRQAANALLKILEEPPSHTVFILIADHLDAFPATISSRCQRTVFPAAESLNRINQPDYRMMGEFYPPLSSRRALFENRQSMTHQLCDLLEGKTDVCHLASAWNTWELEDVLWFMYLLTSTLILHGLASPDASDEMIVRLSDLHYQRRFSAVHLFTQLDTIQEFMKKMNQNIPLNQTLVLETLLLGYMTE